MCKFKPNQIIELQFQVSSYTFDVGPSLSLVEKTVMTKLGEVIGFKECEGIIAPGISD